MFQNNVTNIFNPESNDLQGILEDPTEPLYVSDAIQKCRIKLNENGTEAAAANGIKCYVNIVIRFLNNDNRKASIDCNSPEVMLL